jgi:putative addiction module antidote
MQIELKKIGNSSGFILPKELMQELNLSQGEWLYLTRNADGSFTIGRRDDAFEAAMESARKMMKRYDNALRELAK